MSNCVQLILYLRGQSSRSRAAGRGRLDDDTQGAFYELASGLEEIVVFCFQQTVYTITKVICHGEAEISWNCYFMALTSQLTTYLALLGSVYAVARGVRQ